MKRMFSLLLLLSLLAAPAFAAKFDLTIPAGLSPAVFEDAVKEAGIVIAYRGIAPAEPEGLTGFDAGVEASFFQVDSDVWDQILDEGNGDTPSFLGVPKLHIRKGLPFGLDVGASFATLPSSNLKVIGGELQYAILEGSPVSPALAVRGHYSTLMGVDDLDLSTYGADAVISKGFLMFTPYAGIGVLKTSGSYAGDDPILKTTLEDQDFTEPRVFGGVQIAIALLRVTLDAEFSQVPVYTAKVSLGW